MKARALIAWSCVALTLVLAIAGFYLARRFRQEQLPPGAQRLGAPTDVLQAWPVAERRYYAVSLSSTISLPQGDVMAVETRGKLEAVRLPGVRLELALHYEPREAKLATAPNDEARLHVAMREAFAVSFESSGLVDTVAFAKESAPDPARALARGLMRSVVAGLQLVSPSEPDAEAWTSEERDSVGTFSARYEKVGGLELRKTKTGYTRITGTNPLMNARTELDLASGKLTFERGPWSVQTLRGVTWSERSRVVSEGPLPKLESRQTLSLELLSLERVSEKALQVLVAAGSQFMRSKLDDRRAENRMTLDHSKLGDKGFADVLQQLVTADPKDQKTQARLFSTLKTHLRFEPNSVAIAEKLIRDNSAQKSVLLDALGSAGSETAQEVLRQVVREAGFTADDKRRSMIALSFVETPANETLALLRQQRADPTYGMQALYGLGTAANNLQASNPDAARALALELAAGLAERGNPNKTVDQLVAIGNAANPATLDQIEVFLKDPDPALRAAAVWALRRIPGDRADQGVALGLRDQEASVRRSALEALSYRAPAPVLVYVVREALQTDSDIIVRREFVRAGMRFSAVAPQLRAQLVAMASTDPDRKIRDMLARFGSG